MLLSTTPTIEGKTIKEYRGVVFGEVVNGIDFIKDFTARITNTIGGRADEFEQEIVDTRADALTEMAERAKKIGANAVVGISVKYQPIVTNGGYNGDVHSNTMMMVVATGTAVVLD